jgi:hypothetical protein
MTVWEHMNRDATNQVLATLLAELGWSPRALARRINRTAGPGTVAETAPYHWRDGGAVPRPPLPTLTAWVLSQELARPVTVEELWQGKAAGSPLILPADVDMNVPWSPSESTRMIEDWVASGLLDRRVFLAVSGAALISAAGSPTAYEAAPEASSLRRGGATPLVEQIERGIPLLQLLDDANGGGAHMAYVGAQFRAVGLLVRQGGHASTVERRLLAAVADLGQLAGWMAFDAGHQGLAQRYFFTSLRAARQAGYQTMAAHVLADLAFQAATREHGTDAVALGEAAVRTAHRAPASVRASVHTRLAYGYAIAGRVADAESAHRIALEAFDASQGEDPPWMYYLTPNHLDTQCGYALVHAGVLAAGAGDRDATQSLLRRGQQLLGTGAHNRPVGDPSERRALFEGAWLAVAAAHRGDLEQACAVGRTAIARTRTVRSARSIEVLRLLRRRLGRCACHEHVRDFLPTLNRALTDQTHAG